MGDLPKQDDLVTQREKVIRRLCQEVKKGRTVVPLLGAGISVSAGVPSLREVSRYLAKVSYYLEQGVFRSRPPQRTPGLPGRRASADPPIQSYRHHPQRYLREFGWPDPFELNSDLWHHLLEHPKTKNRGHLCLDFAIEDQILRSLKKIDGGLVGRIESLRKGELWRLSGSYWKLLLTQLTRSSPDLVDTLFQKLTHRRQPATAHRFLAFLTPALRIRLFLTINFDTLLEDALRLEGHRPVVYEVPDGLALPHPLLLQKDLSIVKLHGGAYGLLVGDKLDTPLDEETRARFRSYLPERLILLVMGLGGWDQRVLDMVELTHERHGEVLWLHFEPGIPGALDDRYHENWPPWLRLHRVQDPGGFLRELYSEFKGATPSSRRSFNSSDHRPVPLQEPLLPLFPRSDRGDVRSESDAILVVGSAHTGLEDRLVVFEDRPGDLSLGASGWLARFVASCAETHLPVWIDVETKSTVEDLLVDVIQQLRHYDPGLPPEILIIEQTDAEVDHRHSPEDPRVTFERASGRANGRGYEKVVSRIYAALARGRYIVAFSGVRSFRRWPTRHHASDRFRDEEPRHRQRFVKLLEALLAGSSQREPALARLGLLDSILAFALDLPEGEKTGDDWSRLFEPHVRPRQTTAPVPKIRREEFEEKLPSTAEQDVLTFLSAFRRRRSHLAVRQLGREYLSDTVRRNGHTGDDNAMQSLTAELLRHHGLRQVEGGDLWMSRTLRNRIYDRTRFIAIPPVGSDPEPTVEERCQALLLLTSIHNDLADHHHQAYSGSHDIRTLLEGLYHRVATLRYLSHLDELTATRPVGASSASAPLEGSEWILERYRTGSVPDRDQVLSLRILELRTLAGILEEEQEALLERIPRVTLVQWVEAIQSESRHFKGVALVPGGDGDPNWREAFLAADLRLQEVLTDLKVEALHHALRTEEIPEERWTTLAKVYGLASETASGDRPKGEALLALLAHSTGRGEVPIPQNEMDSAGWRDLYRTFRAIEDALLALQAPGNRPPSRNIDPTERLFEHVERFRENWSAKLSQQRHQETLYSDLEARFHLLKIHRLLAGLSPWASKGHGVCYRQKQLLEPVAEAQRLGLAARQILDRTRESSQLPRTRLYNALGQSHMLLDEYDQAFIQFDLARAGLGEESALEREVLAANLLLQAECLMAYSDSAIGTWLESILESGLLTKADGTESFAWFSALSSEGHRKRRLDNQKLHRTHDRKKHKAAIEEHSQTLLRLSLSNWDPDLLDLIEETTRAEQRELEARVRTGSRRKGSRHPSAARPELAQLPLLADALRATRSRLAAAEDLLERVADLLEASRRRIDLWSFYFHLKAQLSIELLLLLVSGDFPPAETSPEEDDPKYDPRDRLESWLRTGARPEGKLSRHGALDATVPEPLRPQFIHHYVTLLRQGLGAVRQGLDILLPARSLRDVTALRSDRLVGRHLRLWTELMVCGAYLTSMSQKSRPTDIGDDSRRQRTAAQEIEDRWTQWAFLNRLAGLVHLPRSKAMRKWFLRQGDWALRYPGSLSARARVLACMERCLAKPNGGKDRLDGANAIKVLCLALTEHDSTESSNPS